MPPNSDSPSPPYGPVGVARALAASTSSSIGTSRSVVPTSRAYLSIPEPAPISTLFAHEFALTDRVALVTGANRGIGLESAMALCEAGTRVVYCLDLPEQPGEEWTAVRDYLERIGAKGRLEYVSGDVRSQVSASCTAATAWGGY